MHKDSVPLSRPDITQLEIQAVLDVLRTPVLSLGPVVKDFEAALAAKVGRKHGIAINSGTSGLHLCVRALGLGEGDEVITTPFSFVATTNCLLMERVKPIFVDIDPVSYNMDPAAIEAAITPRTKAILPVEVFGNTAHFDRYEAIARKHGLTMIEDCCEALGGRLGSRRAGSFGDCGVFGFYPNKQITTGEGGMIVTDDEDIAQLCRSMRNQGRDSNNWFAHARLGYNYRLSEVSAAMGKIQVQRLEEIVSKRRRVAEMYNQALRDVPGIHLPPMAEPEHASWFVYVIRLADEFTEGNRQALMDYLKDNGIGCNKYFAPIHLQPFIMEGLGTGPGNFPQTERIGARTVALPFYDDLSEAQVMTVKKTLVEGMRKVRS